MCSRLASSSQDDVSHYKANFLQGPGMVTRPVQTSTGLDGFTIKMGIMYYLIRGDGRQVPASKFIANGMLYLT